MKSTIQLKVLLMRVSMVLLLALGGVALSQAQTINRAGASFSYPVYSQWAYKYNQITGMKLNYQSIGPGGGIRQFKTKTVDFGASDAPLKAEEEDQQ